MKLLAFILCVFCFIVKTYSQEQKAPSPILFIYDASGFMWGQLEGKPKKETFTIEVKQGETITKILNF